MASIIGFIGGTGPEGKGLAARFAKAGLTVIIGSRSAERGEEVAREIAGVSGGTVRGATNADAASQSDVVVVTLPYAGQAETLVGLGEAIGNRIVVSTVVPMEFTGGRASMLHLEDGSAAEEAQRLLPEARVVGAFQNLSAHKLFDLGQKVEGDVIVTGNSREAREEVMELAGKIEGIRGVNGGALANSHYVEGITTLIVSINRAYKTEAHVRIVGV
ncbi:MAG TPA: NADPH-dependent F420 reductase [Dehalococcoidia bacterium]|nr:NADPH-dependent F420 reductase [Dehalococcoidia bacterium]